MAPIETVNAALRFEGHQASRSAPDKEGFVILSSMHKKIGMAALTGVALLSLSLGGTGHAPVAAVTQSPVSMAYIGSSVSQWNTLRGNDSLPFETYAGFILNHRGWPGEAAMRRAAEQRIVPGVTGIGDVVRFFNTLPPQTATGHAHHALALQATGRPVEALQAARTAWIMGPFTAELEQRMLSVFGGQLTPIDHDRRIDAVLSAGDTAAGRRLLAYVPPQRRVVHEARLALQTRSPDAPRLVEALGPAAYRDAGLLMDRARYMDRSGNPAGARRLMAQPRTIERPPANPERFMETMVGLARGAANDGQFQAAYQIASQVGDIYPAGADISAKSFGERDEYTNLTWLAGMTALRNLGRPADAAGMFERYGRASQSPQSRTKGLYWAGVGATLSGQRPRAQTLWAEAARNYDQFYGQLAAERLGQPLRSPPADATVPTPVQRQAFNTNSLVAAVRYLGQQGQWTQQTLFARALAEHVDDPAERLLAAELGRQIGRRDLGVLVSREARRTGAGDVHAWGFPELNVPPAQRRLWSVIHGITRQESLFDRQALSSAGARGLMQLMPPTARQVSGQLGMPYALGRLTSDPDYNVMLGSSYFEDLLSQWGGSYPLAIASYNAGPGNVRRFVRENGDPRTPGVDMVEWIERIPFSETRNYVQRVLENAVVYDLMSPQRSLSPPNNRLSFYLGERVG